MSDEEKPAEPGKWYYLYCSSLGELLLHVLVYGIALFLLYSFLHSRGYWQKFVQPVLDIAWYWLGPPAKKIWSFIAPVGDPVVAVIGKGLNWLSNMLHSPIDAAAVKKAAGAAKGGRDGL